MPDKKLELYLKKGETRTTPDLGKVVFSGQQDGEDIYTLPEIDIAAEPRYPVGYWDSLGLQWISENGGIRKTMGPNYRPLYVVKTPEEFEKVRLYSWKQSDPNGTYDFSDKLNKTMATVLMAPFAGMAMRGMLGAGNKVLSYLPVAGQQAVRGAANLGFGIWGYNNLTGEDGVSKTVKLTKQGRYDDAALSAIGDLVDATMVGQLPLRNAFRIGNNIVNRNLISYKYITPLDYTDYSKRIGGFLKGILLDDVRTINPNGNYWEDAFKEAINKSGAPFGPQSINRWDNNRVTSFQKYLTLPERIPDLYIKRKDGTWGINIEKLKQYSIVDPEMFPEMIKNTKRMGAVDWVIGNGANLWRKSRIEDLGSVGGSEYKVQRYFDGFDLHPFSRKGQTIYDKVSRKVRDKANDIYTKLFDLGLYHNRYGYKFLGGKQLNKLRYDFGQSINPTLSERLLKKISDKVKNFEVGPILGGKPFIVKQDIPFTVDQYDVFAVSPEGIVYPKNTKVLSFGILPTRNGAPLPDDVLRFESGLLKYDPYPGVK